MCRNISELGVFRHFCLIYDLCWNTNSRCSFWHIGKDHGVRADAGVIPDGHAAQNFRARTYIDVTAQSRRAGFWTTGAERDLLEEQAVGADDRVGVDHHAVGMRQ